MKNTYCKNCLFAEKVSRKKNTCKFNIIDKIKNIKELTIEDDYYKINNYLCKFGFSKNTYEINKDLIKDIDLEKNLIDRLRLRYYLVIDARYVDEYESIINSIRSTKYQPQYVSILVENDIRAKHYISALETDPTRQYGYKIHCVLEAGGFAKILSMVLDTNLRKNHSQYLWVANKDTISDIDKSIQSIQEIILIDQPDCDLLTHELSNDKDIYGLFMPFEYYLFIKDRFGSLQNIIDSKDSLRIVYYE